MKSKNIFGLILVPLSLSACNVLPVGSESTRSVTIKEHLASVTFDSGTTMNYSIGLGSGAFHYPGDPENVSYFMTDRGPNIKCKDDVKTVRRNLCAKGKIFPAPDYTPRIYKLQFNDHNTNGQSAGTYTVLDMIELKNKDGQIISGMPNDLKVTDRESGFDQHGNAIVPDNEGVDTEAIVRLSDGSFWIAEEYAPSLLHVDAKGHIMQRIVPEAVDTDLKSANYSVSGLLPKILRKRMLNRGIEGLAVSQDEQFLYFALQSPLAHPDKATYKKSRNIRIFKIRLQAGNFAGVVGEYLYMMDLPETFGDILTGAGDVKKNPDGTYRTLTADKIKISEMTVLPTGELIVLERVSKTTKLYRIDLDNASNLLGSKYDNEQTRPSLEEITAPAMAGIRPVQKSLIFNSMHEAPDLPRKIEGIACIGNDRLLLINDNDFNGNVEIRATVIDLKHRLEITRASHNK